MVTKEEGDMADIEGDIAWIHNLRRQAGIRRGIILHGELLDICRDPGASSYSSVSDVVSKVLLESGFDHVVFWDPSAGVSNVTPAEWSELQQATAAEPAREEDGDDYDTGNAGAGVEAQSVNLQNVDDRDFFSVVCGHMLSNSKKRVAFVADWSHYLFGNSRALTDRERNCLLLVSRAVRNSPLAMDSPEALARPTNLVVFLTQKIGSLPALLYQGNPSMTDITVPSPGRNEREQFVKRTIDKWQLRNDPRPGEIEFSDFIDSLEGLALRDLQQLIRLSRQITGEPLTFERLVNLYKYGEQKSPWEDLDHAKLGSIENTLGKRVKGQDEAVAKVAKVIRRAFAGLSGLQHSRKQRMPKGSLFFVGPTGVGKTELAKALAQFLFGDEDSCIRFDMSEFNHEHSDQRLVGAPPGYVGHEDGGQLTNAVGKRPFSVILFDEIEKAHVRILDKFLQILEDGRLTDGRGQTVSFSETVIIFTSNIGAAEVEPEADGAEVRKQFLAKVRSHFVEKAGRPELLNRIGDNIVPFNFILDDEFLVKIARAKLNPLKERLKEKYRITGLEFEDEDKALKALVGGVDKRMGGRGVLNEIVSRIIDPLSDFIFEETQPAAFAGRRILVVQAGDTAVFDFEIGT